MSTRPSWQRRYAFPIVDSSRKNSFRFNPSIEPSTVNLAAVSDTSSTVQGRRHVPSIANHVSGITALEHNPILPCDFPSRAIIETEGTINRKPAGLAAGFLTQYSSGKIRTAFDDGRRQWLILLSKRGRRTRRRSRSLCDPTVQRGSRYNLAKSLSSARFKSEIAQ
jgi:hypothetical protein